MKNPIFIQDLTMDINFAKMGRLPLVLFFLGFLYPSFIRASVPGVGPKDYIKGEKLEVKVANMESIHTQTPMNYYDLPVCTPDNPHADIQTIGDMLLSNTLQNTPYIINMDEDKECALLCTKGPLGQDKTYSFEAHIDQEYKVHLETDNMYALMRKTDPHSSTETYTSGYPLGDLPEMPAEGVYVNNHLDFKIKYKLISPSQYRVVGFEVQSRSLDHIQDPEDPTKMLCEGKGESGPTLGPYSLDSDKALTFTYSVKFEKSDISWATRYDVYMHNRGNSPLIHWFSIVNSLVIVLLLSGIVAMILIRVLYRDIAKYNEMLIGAEDDLEESGWKLVHADVFRKPPHSTVLAALTGSGFQILGMLGITLGLVGFNTFSRSYRGNLVEMMLLLWASMGAVAGYISARLYKLFKSPNWKMTTIRTALVFPGVVFGMFIILNITLRSENSSAAVPFKAILTLLLVWLLISTPLIFLGAYFGYKQSPISLPVRVNKIPRQIPTQPLLMHPAICSLVGGALPFGALFTELLFLFTSIWEHRFYYLFGFLILVLLILIITCAEISILLVYFQLVCEDYGWWWRSFTISGTCGVYIMLYSVYYFFMRLSITHLPGTVIYFGYSFLIAFAFSIFTGAVGFVASFFFLRKIYGSIKID